MGGEEIDEGEVEAVDKDEAEMEGGELGGTLLALEATWILTHTTLVDARNGFNELSRLEMLWKVLHRWLAGTMFWFN